MNYTKAIYYDELEKVMNDLRFIIENDKSEADQKFKDKIVKLVDYMENHLNTKINKLSVLDLRSLDKKTLPKS